jgi:hypothetical protein
VRIRIIVGKKDLHGVPAALRQVREAAGVIERKMRYCSMRLEAMTGNEKGMITVYHRCRLQSGHQEPHEYTPNEVTANVVRVAPAITAAIRETRK